LPACAQVAATDGRVAETRNDATIARRRSEDTVQKVDALYNKQMHHALPS
jgi:hypothetical protein